jgi:hypothetical protein
VFIGAIRLDSKSPIQVALAIMTKDQHLLVRHSTEGKADFPFYLKIHAEKPETEFNQLLEARGLGNLPTQILYLSLAKGGKTSSKNSFLLIGIIHLKDEQKAKWPDCQFEPFDKLVKKKSITTQLQGFLDWFQNFKSKHR